MVFTLWNTDWKDLPNGLKVLGFVNQLRSAVVIWIFITVLFRKQIQVIIQESFVEYSLYLKYRIEPETNITTLHLLDFHIYEEKSSYKIGKQQTKILLRTELSKRTKKSNKVSHEKNQYSV